MKDDADPLDGWSSNKYIKFAPIAKSDAYGALFFYLRHLLLAFCKRTRLLAISFQLLATDAVDLPYFLTNMDFDRIEVCLKSLKSSSSSHSHRSKGIQYLRPRLHRSPPHFVHLLLSSEA
jgi:hypothetical protein